MIRQTVQRTDGDVLPVGLDLNQMTCAVDPDRRSDLRLRLPRRQTRSLDPLPQLQQTPNAVYGSNSSDSHVSVLALLAAHLHQME